MRSAGSDRNGEDGWPIANIPKVHASSSCRRRPVPSHYEHPSLMSGILGVSRQHIHSPTSERSGHEQLPNVGVTVMGYQPDSFPAASPNVTAIPISAKVGTG